MTLQHLQRVRHAKRGRLLLRTPGPVPYGICKCSFVETSDTQSYITPVYDNFPWLDFSPTLTLLLNKGFHKASATGVACRQGTLTPPDTWSCPTLGLASVLMLRPISPELVLFLDFWVSNIPRYFCFCILTLDQQWFPYRSDFPSISWPLYRASPSPNYEWFPWSICNGCG